ncbi:phage tail protein [Actinotalea sp. K2]|uniref:phage tail protein n=1 Tax=Actinotalea sp. K2 TaxID=2939438 RepID=UPI0020179DB8|nr:phage tail protein [Actinotalea sp. K2]MCL3860419.1 phage tail protein [Actinotalea sp. K2]
MGDPGTTVQFDVVIDEGGSNTSLGVFTGCQGLSAEFEVLEYAEGGQNGYVHRLPGRLRFPNLVLTRGLDASSAAVAAWFHGQRDKVGRTTAVVTAYDAAGQAVVSWSLRDVCPVRWTGPAFSASSGQVAIETLELAHHGFDQESP